MTETQVCKDIKLIRHARIFKGFDLSDLTDEELSELVGDFDINMPNCLSPINPLLQLFSVCVEFKGGNKPAKMYGYVDIDLSGSGSGPGFFPLFEREPEDSIPICNKGLVPLTDPSSYHGISAADSLVEISVELYVLFEGEDRWRQICNSCLTWDITNDLTTRFDACLSREFVGEYGSARIYYMVPRGAIEATIEVSFDDDGARGRNVCGKILAYGQFSYDCSPDMLDYYKLTLFEAESSSTFLPTGKIPLRRSVLALPGFSYLIIKADLHDGSGKEIFNAVHQFRVELDGSISDHIEGKIPGCSLALKVDWKCKPLIDNTVCSY